jgi:hypothetical protein
MRSKKWFQAVPVMSLLIAFVLPLGAQTQTNNTQTQAAEPVEYTIEDIQGTVQVLEDGSKDWEPAEEGQVLEGGDEVKTGDNSEASLTMQSETSVHLGTDTDMKVDQIKPNETGGFLSQLQVLAGSILADVKKHLEESHSSFEIESNGVVCGVRGTAFELTAEGDTAQIATHEGSVAVGSGNETHLVEAGNFSKFQKGKFLLQRKLDQKEIERFQKWRALRQRIFKRRLQRLEEIRDHKRAVWVRKHPHLAKTLLKKELRKKRRHKR